MTSQKYTGIFYSDFDPNMKLATNEKGFLKKMKQPSKKKKADLEKSTNRRKNQVRTGSELNIGVVGYDK